MSNRLKRSLTDSYIGAIALGWLLAEDILHFVGIFATPVGDWVTQRVYPGFRAQAGGPQGISFELALPEVIRFVLILAIWYALVRWLYFSSVNTATSSQSDQNQPV